MDFLASQTITKALFLCCISVAFADRLNYTKRYEKRFFPRLRDPPGKIEPAESWRAGELLPVYPAALVQDVPFLPEDDYGEFKDDSSEFPDVERDGRNLMQEYRSLCQTRTSKVELTDAQFEYQPPHYHEVYCKGYSIADRIQELTKPSQQMCAHPSFHCVQRSKTFFALRRRWESDCWEPYSKQVASGCECMWPVAILGEINEHY